MKNLEHHLLGKHPRIGFAEGANPDVIRAAIRHVENGFILPVLIGHKKEILWHAKEMGYIDGLVGGVIATTAETMRPALQLIRTAENERTVSSCVLLERDNVHYIMGDCTLNVDPSVSELVEITLQCARTARQFGIEPKVGILSYSTFGSGSGASVDKVRVVAERLLK